MTLENLVLLLHSALVNSESSIIQNQRIFSGQLTKTEAYKRYGRSNVDRWVKEGLLKITNRKIDRTSIEAIAASSNRRSYLPTLERQ
ncbi:hypothetical protein DIU31_009045 [Mucilaginibacter rubeus]|uniref:Uncharacterized protein n=1 Tax=Mucilaginibacter rubeus TaxID=2027860 RepID=A0AAE6JDE6_9SPHI|nr:MULTISPECIES: hypothetical protein [Mucilaginibacter]QEM03654.1 hypothetical protein DIU31_009045 [Mucilaginibacter rubeus]QEM16265.1 hypothetical protein DIU38_009140 [Mucilaginibacter gossypii]QTE58968.1 hypothetical protein J3L23_10260 [Mucilaginibacter rubeus]QTE61571.1 hypothetical protein J3L22_23585 [Mucilaginibacter rubeus]QTF60329.1 hypothetical protein J3L20_23230 [Mucilaginibacter rubeus]